MLQKLNFFLVFISQFNFYRLSFVLFKLYLIFICWSKVYKFVKDFLYFSQLRRSVSHLSSFLLFSLSLQTFFRDIWLYEVCVSVKKQRCCGTDSIKLSIVVLILFFVNYLTFVVFNGIWFDKPWSAYCPLVGLGLGY